MLSGMWNLLRLGIEPVSPAQAGGGLLSHLAPREALHVCFKIMIFFTRLRDPQEQAWIPDRYLFMILLLQVSVPKSSHSRRTFQWGLSLLPAESPH